ncbi:MAG TPA: protein phosphatase 2C domain-containing protein [Acidimicrobiales bacterium]|nr:protein phosphatase 2C domain-containing protein [Acidimicrobiales bacterium]
MIEAAVVTHPGSVRFRNEDTVALPGIMTVAPIEVPFSIRFADGPVLFAVIDGMGGHRGGQEASRLVAQSLLNDANADVRAALVRANAAVYDEMQRVPDLRGMGATVAGVAIDGSDATVFNVGDARAYHFSQGYLMLATVDDRADPASAVVTQSLGGGDRPRAIDPHIAEVSLGDGDRLLLCSDGLSEVVPFGAIEEVLGGVTLDHAAAVLLRSALDAGAPDNVSIVVLEHAASGGVTSKGR